MSEGLWFYTAFISRAGAAARHLGSPRLCLMYTLCSVVSVYVLSRCALCLSGY